MQSPSLALQYSQVIDCVALELLCHSNRKVKFVNPR